MPNGLSLKAARVNANLTQKAAAQKLNVCQKTISNWESGKRSPRMDQVKRLCEGYGVNHGEIFFGA